MSSNIMRKFFVHSEFLDFSYISADMLDRHNYYKYEMFISF